MCRNYACFCQVCSILASKCSVTSLLPSISSFLLHLFSRDQPITTLSCLFVHSYHGYSHGIHILVFLAIDLCFKATLRLFSASIWVKQCPSFNLCLWALYTFFPVIDSLYWLVRFIISMILHALSFFWYQNCFFVIKLIQNSS